MSCPACISALEQAFQPKWCSSFPRVGRSAQPTTFPKSSDDSSTSMTANASGRSPARSNATTYASFSVGAATASAALR